MDLYATNNLLTRIYYSQELPSTIGYLKKLRIFNADENYLFYLPSEVLDTLI